MECWLCVCVYVCGCVHVCVCVCVDTHRTVYYTHCKKTFTCICACVQQERTIYYINKFLIFQSIFRSVAKFSSFSWELQMQKLKTNLFRTLRSKVLPLKPGVDQNIAMHASPTARDFFLGLISTSPVTFPVHSPSFFPKPHKFFLCQPWLMQVPMSAHRIKQLTLLVTDE